MVQSAPLAGGRDSNSASDRRGPGHAHAQRFAAWIRRQSQRISRRISNLAASPGGRVSSSEKRCIERGALAADGVKSTRSRGRAPAVRSLGSPRFGAARKTDVRQSGVSEARTRQLERDRQDTEQQTDTPIVRRQSELRRGRRPRGQAPRRGQGQRRAWASRRPSRLTC